MKNKWIASVKGSYYCINADDCIGKCGSRVEYLKCNEGTATAGIPYSETNKNEYECAHYWATFEISVVREGDHGVISYGWPSIDKMILLTSEDVYEYITEDTWDIFKRRAEVITEALNLEEKDN